MLTVPLIPITIAVLLFTGLGMFVLIMLNNLIDRKNKIIFALLRELNWTARQYDSFMIKFSKQGWLNCTGEEE